MDSYVRARVDIQKKEQAEAYLKENGLNISTAIRTFIYALADKNEAVLTVPNATTIKAMQDTDLGRTAKFDAIEDLLADLHKS